MKKTIFLMILLGFICCNQKPKKSTRSYNAKDFEKYDLSISNVDYDYDLNSGKFKIVFSNYIDNIKLTNEQKNKIAKVFLKTILIH